MGIRKSAKDEINFLHTAMPALIAQAFSALFDGREWLIA